MLSRSPLRTYSLLLVLGVALVWVAFSAGGVETNAVYEYTAYEVEHADGELAVTNARTGRTDGVRAEDTNLDERVVCLPSHTRQCDFERRALDGNVSAEGISSDYRYVYLDGEFHRISRESLGKFEYERTDPTEALAGLAVDSAELHPDERRAIENGRAITTHAFANTNRFVRHDGAYYTLLATARKTYGAGGSFCASSGDGFCGDADALRWKLRLRRIGIGVLGALGVFVGGQGLRATWRAD